MRPHLKLSKLPIPLLLLIAAFTFSVASLTLNPQTRALSANDFNAGKIIDDGVFYNKDSMNIQQIQDFLNRLIPNCDTWGSSPSEYGGGTRAQYAASRGWHGPPYVCLNNYHENPNTGETSYERGGGAFNGGVSAAQIIYHAAQTYNINPQVLLVLLKKESAGPLTADRWPLKTQYRYAMGYACPDSGPGYSANCSADKAGFFKQMTLAAWQMKYYREHSNDYRYRIGWNDIQYSTNPSCGTRRVYIENIATLSLYIYTPYTPNPGALANYPGEAHCGAYGNRNFFMFFKEWFGTTYGHNQVDMLTADQKINEVYNRFRTQLGSPTSDKVPDFNANVRVWQNFQNGTVIWTRGYGAHPVLFGSLYDRWRTLGGSTGSLGVPTDSPTTESSDGRIWQNFQNGMIISSSSTGSWEVFPGPLSDKWRELGGSEGTLGKPTSSVVATGTLRKQSFERGVTARAGFNAPAYAISGRIYSSWQNSQNILQAPTTDAHKENSDGRIWQNFSQGTVIDNGNAAWIVPYGAINDRWRVSGGSVGKLGKPTSNQFTESDGRTWQNFEKGTVIMKKSANTAFDLVFGDIYDRWRQLGGSTGSLGTPQSTAYTESDGRTWQNFEKGTVIKSTSTGTWEVQEGFYTFWKDKGGSLGRLGKPIGQRHIDSNNVRWQDFEHGRAVWSPITGWSIE